MIKKTLVMWTAPGCASHRSTLRMSIFRRSCTWFLGPGAQRRSVPNLHGGRINCPSCKRCCYFHSCWNCKDVVFDIRILHHIRSTYRTRYGNNIQYFVRFASQGFPLNVSDCAWVGLLSGQIHILTRFSVCHKKYPWIMSNYIENAWTVYK